MAPAACCFEILHGEATNHKRANIVARSQQLVARATAFLNVQGGNTDLAQPMHLNAVLEQLRS